MKDIPVGAVIALAFGVVTFLVLGLAIVFPGTPQAAPTPAAPAPTVTASPEPAASTLSDPDYDFLAGPGETAKVTRIIDGDTFAVGRRIIKVIGIDSCPTSTAEGRQAAEFAQNQLMDGVVLRRAPELNKDSAGRELRVVEDQEHGFDYAQSIVPFHHTKANAGGPGPAAYLSTLRDMDSDGRDCSEPRQETTTTTPSTPRSDDDDHDIYIGRRDSGTRDGALTGGYCRKKWWC